MAEQMNKTTEKTRYKSPIQIAKQIFFTDPAVTAANPIKQKRI